MYCKYILDGCIKNPPKYYNLICVNPWAKVSDFPLILLNIFCTSRGLYSFIFAIDVNYSKKSESLAQNDFGVLLIGFP